MSISSKRHNLPLHKHTKNKGRLTDCRLTKKLRNISSMIQHQHWEDSIRILVTDEQHHGSIQAFIPHRTEDRPLDGEADALIYSLWVDEAHRGHEVAKHLMETVEKELKYCGVESVAISWNGRDSPPWVLHWYERLGYEEKTLGHQCSTLLKRL